MRLSRLLVAVPLLGVALLLSRPLAAQTPGVVPHQPAAWRPQASGLLAPMPTAQPAEAPGARLEVSARQHHGQAVALMIVGAAGIVTGLLVEEDIITIAGAAVGGVGLYLYLR